MLVCVIDIILKLKYTRPLAVVQDLLPGVPIIYVYVYMYIYICMHMYICIYVYTY